MKKNLLIFKALTLFLFSFIKAQQGTIVPISFPTELTAGDTVDITFEYTSDVNGFWEIQFLHLRSGGNPIWLSNVTFDRGPAVITTTPIEVTISVEIPIDTEGTSDLQSPAAHWGWFGKLDTSLEESGDDYAFFNDYPITFTYPANTLGNIDFHKEDKLVYFDQEPDNLMISSDSGIKNLGLFDLTGKTIINIDVTKNGHQIDLSNIDPGIYIVRYESGYLKFSKS